MKRAIAIVALSALALFGVAAGATANGGGPGDNTIRLTKVVKGTPSGLGFTVRIRCFDVGDASTDPSLGGTPVDTFINFGPNGGTAPDFVTEDFDYCEITETVNGGASSTTVKAGDPSRTYCNFSDEDFGSGIDPNVPEDNICLATVTNTFDSVPPSGGGGTTPEVASTPSLVVAGAVVTAVIAQPRTTG